MAIVTVARVDAAARLRWIRLRRCVAASIYVAFCGLLMPVVGFTATPIAAGSQGAREYGESFAEFIAQYEERRRAKKSYYAVYARFAPGLGVYSMLRYLDLRDSACHGAAHELGRVTAEHVPALAEAMAVCGDGCTYGCVHGVFKTYFMRGGDGGAGAADHAHGHRHEHNAASSAESDTTRVLAAIRSEITSVCADDSQVVPDFFRGNCAHSVGHAFGGLAPDVKTAVNECRIFAESEMQFYCETGLFMERGTSITSRLYQRGMSYEQRLRQGMTFCDEVSTMPGACMRFVVPAAETLERGQQFAQACTELKTISARRQCFNTLGFYARDFAARQPTGAPLICNASDESERRACVAGIALMKKNHTAKDELEMICASFSDDALRGLCHEQGRQHYYQLGNAALQAILN